MRSPLVARRILMPAVGLALAAALAGCSSSSSSSATTSASNTPTAASTPVVGPATPVPATSSSASAVAEITANWEKFFNSSTPTAQRVALLQNGSTFATAISGLSGLVSKLGAKVTNVTLNSATTATVTYNLTAGGSSLLTGQTGTAVLENGVWKVGDASLCGLLKLVPGGTVPSACSSAS
jgi:purine-cytosine permease-like protein